MSVRVIQGDCREALRELDAESVDACCTDPPYGLEFMGKEWDRLDVRQPDDATFHRSGAGPFDRAKVRHSSAASYGGNAGAGMQAWHEGWAREVYRVLKPGAHVVAFGGSRTFHRLTCGIEDAGFEIRDCLCWMFGSGFPKSHNLPGGLGTALKPGWEPIVLARKPLVGTVAANVAQHGTGALNIDGCRLDGVKDTPASPRRAPQNAAYGDLSRDPGTGSGWDAHVGRWPANVVLDEAAAGLLDASVPASQSRIGQPRKSSQPGNGYGMTHTGAEYDDAGGPSRFFYTAKASRAERNKGLLDLAPQTTEDGRDTPIDNPFLLGETARRNHHPTVKPVSLMQWLVRLVTPKGGVVLDPFAGSGTTGIAADREGFDAIMIEREAEYVAIMRRRIRGDAPLFADVV